MSLQSDIGEIFLRYPKVEQSEMVVRYIEKVILADLYKESSKDVARLCNEKLDHSGALLGRVREYARYGRLLS